MHSPLATLYNPRAPPAKIYLLVAVMLTYSGKGDLVVRVALPSLPSSPIYAAELAAGGLGRSVTLNLPCSSSAASR
jgi:hypothetical protein